MQKKHFVLSIDTKYFLLGIITNTPVHTLVYYLNKDLNTSFKREKDIYFIENKTKAYLNKYTHYDEETEQEWTLVSNQVKMNLKGNQNTMFLNDPEIYQLTYLIPEYKRFNYIIKIEGLLTQKKRHILKINNVSNVEMASEIKQNLIKNPDKLLF